MNKIPLTQAGAEKLTLELNHLKSVERPRIINAIAEARAHGDLKENAEYHAAREQQSFAEGRIAKLESVLSNVQIIDVKKITNQGKVIFGATVTITNLSNNEPITYQLVGDEEADIKAHKIAISSPIARGLIGKQEDDEVIIQTPAGPVEYAISKVEYL